MRFSQFVQQHSVLGKHCRYWYRCHRRCWWSGKLHLCVVIWLAHFFFAAQEFRKMNLNQKGREGSVRRLLILPIKANAKVLQRPERASNSARTELQDCVSFSAFCIAGVGRSLVNPFTVGVRMQQIWKQPVGILTGWEGASRSFKHQWIRPIQRWMTLSRTWTRTPFVSTPVTVCGASWRGREQKKI